MKKLFLFTFIFFFGSVVVDSLIFAQEKQAQSTKSNPEEKTDIPEWIKRTNIAIEVGSDIKPKYFLETIQPLLGTTPDSNFLFFNQTRVSGRDFRTTYNTGFGLRKIFKEQYLAGINTFYDYQDLHQHHRSGIGFELITDRGIEARTNTYLRISNKRLVKDDGVNEYFESVANGFDWEFGAPFPYIPYLKLYGGGNWYNFEHFKNKYGWQLRMEYSPIKNSRIDFIVLDDTKRKDVDDRFEGAITLAFTSFSLRDIIKDIKGSKQAYPKIDLNDKVLDRVVRDFDITVIKSTKSKATGLTVEGGRT